MKKYRNVKIEGESISGEYQDCESMPWCAFSAHAKLMKISAVVFAHPGDPLKSKAVELIWRLQDGYGEAGFTPPQGFDWSGIRDSSDEAIDRMLAVAEWAWRDHPWPWEELTKAAVADRRKRSVAA